MRSLRPFVVVLALAGLICIWAPAGALASGCGGSAGDNQYVDPLQHCNPAGSGHSSGSGGSGGSGSSTTPTSTPTPSSSTTPTATTAASTTSTTTTSSTGAKDPKSGKTLPFTGLDLGAALIVATVLLGGGLLLRRVAGEIR